MRIGAAKATWNFQLRHNGVIVLTIQLTKLATNHIYHIQRNQEIAVDFIFTAIAYASPNLRLDLKSYVSLDSPYNFNWETRTLLSSRDG